MRGKRDGKMGEDGGDVDADVGGDVAADGEEGGGRAG